MIYHVDFNWILRCISQFLIFHRFASCFYNEPSWIYTIQSYLSASSNLFYAIEISHSLYFFLSTWWTCIWSISVVVEIKFHAKNRFVQTATVGWCCEINQCAFHLLWTTTTRQKKTRIPIPNQGENSIFQYPRHLQLISSRMHQNFTEFFPSHFFYLPFSLALTPSRSPFSSQAPSLLFIHHLSSFSAFLSLSPRLAPFVCTLYFGAFIFKWWEWANIAKRE